MVSLVSMYESAVGLEQSAAFTFASNGLLSTVLSLFFCFRLIIAAKQKIHLKQLVAGQKEIKVSHLFCLSKCLQVLFPERVQDEINEVVLSAGPQSSQCCMFA